MDLATVAPTSVGKLTFAVASVVLLTRTLCVFLPGGLSSFKQNHENLCDNSLQLQECREVGGGASAASSMLPQSVPTTPDIENAELTPILPFLFLGNEQDAQDLDTMQRLNIGYVINVTTHLPLYHYEKGLFNYKRLPATDSNKQNLRQYFEEAFEFIGNYCLGCVGSSPFPSALDLILGPRFIPRPGENKRTNYLNHSPSFKSRNSLDERRRIVELVRFLFPWLKYLRG